MTYFAFDFETVAWFKDKAHKDLYLDNKAHKGLKDPEKVAGDRAKKLASAALNPSTGEIIVIGTKTDEKEVVLYTKPEKDIDDPIGQYCLCKSEGELLARFWELLDEAVDEGARLVSFGGKAFDLPFGMVRSLLNNVRPPRVPYDKLIHNYNHDYHLDIRSFIEKGTLSELIYVLGLGEAGDITGADVARLWKEDPIKVLQKCSSDNDKTIAIYKGASQWIPPKMIMY